MSAISLSLVLFSQCSHGKPEDREHRSIYSPVDGNRITAASSDEWLTHGRTYSEQRFSPLNQINEATIPNLKLAWWADLPTTRGIEATPIVVDGVMFTTGSWSIVYAYDAVSGKELWRFDPKVPRADGAKACCDVVNRGVAVWGDSLFFGTIDGRLIALDRRSGKEIWQTVTVDQTLNYTITGAPRIAEGKVLIGNGGADMGHVRGYVSAYDVSDGSLLWRFYTVPGDPSKGYSDPAMRMAADTWKGEWWKLGGGGTAWDSIVFDPETRLVFIGVGNGSPWNQRIRSPGGGDNLFLSSIVAVDIDNGKYVWHYQTTPGEVWDYTATQSIILAELLIDGKNRKVLMQAPKNGFFYVIDRISGELLSAEPYAKVTWAKGIDKETGRPIEAPLARYPGEEMQLVAPGPGGAHNWHPMAYSPLTGLAYIPGIPTEFPYQNASPFNLRPGPVEMGIEYSAFAPPADMSDKEIPSFPAGYVSAWDPLEQVERWRVSLPATWNGGLLVTGGNLVFHGTTHGFFQAYSADSGKILWSSPTHTGVMAGPITYRINGVQYVAVMAGWGGVMATHASAFLKGVATENHSRVLVYSLDGKANLPKPTKLERRPLQKPPEIVHVPERIEQGRLLFDRYCQFCHGAGAISGTLIPDLRYADQNIHDFWNDIVLGGAFEPAGMPGFSKYLSGPDESLAIREYVISRALQEYKIREGKNPREKDHANN